MRRFVAAIVIVAGTLAVLGSTYRPGTYRNPSGTFDTPGYPMNDRGSDIPLPVAGGVYPVWQILSQNGQNPTLYYGVDYDPTDTKEAAYVYIEAGPLNPGSDFAWTHVYGDSTAGSASGPHTTSQAISYAAYQYDVLHYAIRTWTDADVFIEQTAGTIEIEEQIDTSPPLILTPPTITWQYTENGGDVTISLTGGSYSEDCYKSLYVDYGSSYPDYDDGGGTDRMYNWKTRSVGVDSAQTTDYVSQPEFVIDHAYHTDPVFVRLLVYDDADNWSDPETIYDGTIEMPIGDIPTLAHDEYKVAAYHSGGRWPSSGTVAEWATSHGIIVPLGHLSGDDWLGSDGSAYADAWLKRARATAGAVNVVAVEHGGPESVNDPYGRPSGYRKHRFFGIYWTRSRRPAALIRSGSATIRTTQYATSDPIRRLAGK